MTDQDIESVWRSLLSGKANSTQKSYQAHIQMLRVVVGGKSHYDTVAKLLKSTKHMERLLDHIDNGGIIGKSGQCISQASMKAVETTLYNIAEVAVEKGFLRRAPKKVIHRRLTLTEILWIFPERNDGCCGTGVCSEEQRVINRRNHAIQRLIVDFRFQCNEIHCLNLGDVNMTDKTIRVPPRYCLPRWRLLPKVTALAFEQWLEVRREGPPATPFFTCVDGEPMQQGMRLAADTVYDIANRPISRFVAEC